MTEQWVQYWEDMLEVRSNLDLMSSRVGKMAERFSKMVEPGQPDVQQLKPKMPSYGEASNGCISSGGATFPVSYCVGLKDMYDYIARHFGH